MFLRWLPAATKATCFFVHIHDHQTKDLSWTTPNHHGGHVLRPGFLIIPISQKGDEIVLIGLCQLTLNLWSLIWSQHHPNPVAAVW